MKCRVKVHNTRFAVVVCARHILKRPSKRSALVLMNSESLKKSSNPWISRDFLEFWYVISMYHMLPIGKNEICNVSTFWSLHISHCIIVSFRTFWYFTMNVPALTQLTEFSEQLTTDDIGKFKVQLNLPTALFQVTGGVQFLIALKIWGNHNPYAFYQALLSIRPDLVPIAMQIPWLCNAIENEYEDSSEQLSIKTLITLLKTALTVDNLSLIYVSISTEIEESIDFETTLHKLLEKGYIQTDLKALSILLLQIKRDDIVRKLELYQNVLGEMDKEKFQYDFKNVIASLVKEMKNWMLSLRQFLLVQNKQVKQILGKDDSVSLAHVFVELTILRQRPRAINYKDETTYNEIAYLRRIANKTIDIEPIDFTEELKAYTPEEPEIWCLIGNPGCGKTFLAKRTALRFGQNELTNISYSIAIPCRNTNWHNMESTRMEEDRTITAEFVQDWLCIGLPVASEWPKELSKHLTKSDGEGLLLIIDGLDEFTKKVPFEKTLLYLLLTRQSLHRSNIILTTRPGAWTDISSKHELKVDRYYQVLGFSPENRDLYFEKQIVSEYRLNECKRLLERYDEMSQLALIPVNASLFAALLKDESVSIHTLTQLYDELTCYLIRRQLCRMGLEELADVTNIQLFHPCVKDCLHSIGQIALGGVYRRELTSIDKVSLTIDHVETESQWRRKLIKTRGANLCNYVHLQIGERNIWVTYILYDYDSMTVVPNPCHPKTPFSHGAK